MWKRSWKKARGEVTDVEMEMEMVVGMVVEMEMEMEMERWGHTLLVPSLPTAGIHPWQKKPVMKRTKLIKLTLLPMMVRQAVTTHAVRALKG
jgi:hypothetical protein